MHNIIKGHQIFNIYLKTRTENILNTNTAHEAHTMMQQYSTLSFIHETLQNIKKILRTYLYVINYWIMNKRGDSTI